MNSDEPSKRGVRSYVLRTGRMTDSQKRAVDKHWQYLGLQIKSGMIDCQQVFARQAPLVVEVGFGMGESLLTMAQQEPDKNFVGIEVHTPGVGRLLNNLAANGVENVRLYQDDAQVVLDHCIADNSICRLQLYFPDPWPKKKHHKRRIVQLEFVEKVWRKLIPGGIFHIATDWQAYAEHMLEVFAQCPNLFRNQAGPAQFSPRPDYRPTTKFELRGQRLDHGVWDLLFEKIG